MQCKKQVRDWKTEKMQEVRKRALQAKAQGKEERCKGKVRFESLFFISQIVKKLFFHCTYL